MSSYLQNHTITELNLSTNVKYSVPRIPPGTNDTEITCLALSQRNYNLGLGERYTGNLLRLPGRSVNTKRQDICTMGSWREWAQLYSRGGTERESAQTPLKSNLVQHSLYLSGSICLILELNIRKHTGLQINGTFYIAFINNRYYNLYFPFPLISQVSQNSSRCHTLGSLRDPSTEKFVNKKTCSQNFQQIFYCLPY